MGRMSTEHRLVQKIIDGLNVLDIDPVTVGALLSLSSNYAIQKRLYLICMKLLYNWAIDYDSGDFPDDMAEVVVNSKRIVEAFERKGGMNPN